jgi:DNA-directed RNA polymerase sigma subunit (sigma70/sigma32)
MPAPLPNALSRGMARHALTPAEQAPLWREYRRRPTPELRQRLALANLRLVAAVAGGWKGPPDHDAFQAGVEGLLLAVEKYEPKRGTTFGTCALWWIRASITRRQAQPGLQVSGAAISKASKVTKAREHLARQLGRTPSETELAAWLELPAPKVAQALDAARARRRHASLSSPSATRRAAPPWPTCWPGRATLSRTWPRPRRRARPSSGCATPSPGWPTGGCGTSTPATT